MFLDLKYIVKSELTGDAIVQMHSDNMLKEHSSTKPFKVTFPKRKDCHDEQRRCYLFTTGGALWYINASQDALGSGPGVFVMIPSAEITIALGKFPTIF